MIKGLIDFIADASYEAGELERFLLPENKDKRTLVFFAENGLYLRYYEDYIEHILANSDLDICYISSDRHDPIFINPPARIHPFYIKNSLAAVIARLDAKVLVMATPDLGKGVFKKSSNTVHHVHAFRGISSIHQAYRLGALDNYESLLCVAQYQIDEIRETERIYKLKPKNLILTGYPLMERVYRDHLRWEKEHGNNHPPICLVAPTWDYQKRSSILDTCIEELLESLAKSDLITWLRPHPEFIKRYPKKITAIQNIIKRHNNMELQLNLSSLQCIHEADFLITDHSTISMDFALGTERPVLFIDTPVRIDNPERDRVSLIPVENVFREQLGACLSIKDLDQASKVLTRMHDQLPEFKKSLPALRSKLVANWQKAASIGGDYILGLCS